MNIRHDHVTVFVVRRAGAAHEFLQLRRSRAEYLSGTWQTVRGTMEAGESAVQTALRELREETGLTPAEFYSLGIVETFYIAPEDAIFYSPAFVAFIPANASVTLNSENDAFRWVDVLEFEAACMWPSERPLLAVIRLDLLTNAPCKAYLRVKL